MPIILDASAILSGKELVLEGEVIIPSSVAEEIRPGPRRRKMEYWLQTCARVASASEESLEKVLEAAGRTGDDARISKADAEVLAIALDTGGTVYSDDYSIQNLALYLGIPYISISEGGIRNRVEWTYRCRGCGRYYEKMLADCPVCGSELKSARKPR